MNILKTRILLLGGNSYIGRGLIEHFRNELDFEIYSYTRNWNKGIDDLNIQQINGPITEKKVIANLISVEPHTIINLISLNHSDSELDLKSTVDSNVYPLWDILFSNEFNCLKQVIYFSTIHVYNQKENITINENYIPSPKNIYGLTHLLSEQINSFYGEKKSYRAINIRLSNAFGFSNLDFEKGKGWHYAINDLVKQAVLSNNLILSSNGLPSRDFISLDFITSTLSTIIKSKSIKSNIYNLSRSENYSIIQIAKFIREIFLQEYQKDVEIYINNNYKVDQKELLELTQKNEPYPIFSNEKIVKDLNIIKPNDITQELKKFIKEIIKRTNENWN